MNVAQVEATIAAVGDVMTEVLGDRGRTPRGVGNRSPAGAPHGC